MRPSSANQSRGVLAGPALGLVLALLAGPLTAPEPAHAARTLSCPGAGGKTVLRTKQLRIFTKYNRETPPNPDYFGCLYRKRTAFRLNVSDPYGVAIDRRRLLVRGHHVAIVQHLGSGAGGDSDLVVVRDLLTGQRSSGPYYPSEGEAVVGLVLNPNGVAAFIYAGYVDRRPPVPKNPPTLPESLQPFQVHVLARSKTRLLEQGPDIDPTSLELGQDDKTVTYLKGGELRSTPIE